MPSIDSLNTLLVEELRDIYDAEHRLTKAIPKLAKAASSDDLRAALEKHLTETEQQIERLNQAFEHLDEPAKRKACAGMRGLIEEGDEHAKEDYEDDGLRDAAIIGAAQRVEHYEMAAYGTAVAHARLLGLGNVVRLLEQSLAEEKAADQTLTEIAEAVVNPDAATRDEDEDKDEDEPAARRRGQSMSAARATAAAAVPRKSRKATSPRRSSR